MASAMLGFSATAMMQSISTRERFLRGARLLLQCPRCWLLYACRPQCAAKLYCCVQSRYWRDADFSRRSLTASRRAVRLLCAFFSKDGLACTDILGTTKNKSERAARLCSWQAICIAIVRNCWGQPAPQRDACVTQYAQAAHHPRTPASSTRRRRRRRRRGPIQLKRERRSSSTRTRSTRRTPPRARATSSARRRRDGP